MPDPAGPSSCRRRPRRWRRRLLIVAAVLLALATATAAGLPVAVERGVPWWLARHGVEGASLSVVRLTPFTFDLAAVRLGPRLKAARLELAWAPPWTAGGWRPRAVRIEGLDAEATLSPAGLDLGGAETLLPPAWRAALPTVAAGTLHLRAAGDVTARLTGEPARPLHAAGTATVRLDATGLTLPGVVEAAEGTATLRLSGSDESLAVGVSAPATLALRPPAEVAARLTAALPEGERLNARLESLAVTLSPARDAAGGLLATGSLRAEVSAGPARLDLAAAVDASLDGTGGLRALAVPTAALRIADLPLAGARWRGHLGLADLTGTWSAMRSPLVTVSLHAEALRLPEAAFSAPGIGLEASGGLAWEAPGLTFHLAEGSLSAAAGTILGDLRLTRPLAWTLAATEEADKGEGEDAPALRLSLAAPTDSAPHLELDITARRPALEASLDGLPLRLAFAAARLRADDLLAAVGAPTVRLDAHGGSGMALLADVADAVVAYTEDAGGMRATLDAALTRLPGEDAPPPPGALRPLRLKAAVTRSAPGRPLALEIAVARPDGRSLASASGRHDQASGRGSLRIDLPPLALTETGPHPGDLHAAAAGLRFAGTLGARGSVDWSRQGVTSALDLLIGDGTLEAGGITIERLNGVIRLDRLAPPRTPPGQLAAAAVVRAGLPFTDAEIRFHLDGAGTLVVEDATLSLAGGTLHPMAPIRVPLDLARVETTLAVEGVDLGGLAALAEVAGLEADGRLDGTLPLVVAGGDVRITEAELIARGPGTLRYRPPADGGGGLGGMALDPGGVGLVLQALEDFRYETLRLTADGTAGSTLSARLHIKGANPGLYDGYPVELNLALSGALAEILRAGTQGYQVPERIRQRLQGFQNRQ